MATETGWTQYERDNLACAIAESDVTDGLLRNEDIDALVDLFEAWTERRKSPSDAEQLSELRSAVCEFLTVDPAKDVERWCEIEQRLERLVGIDTKKEIAAS